MRVSSQKIHGHFASFEQSSQRGEDTSVRSQRIGEQKGNGYGAHQIRQKPYDLKDIEFLASCIQKGGKQKAQGNLKQDGKNHDYHIMAECRPEGIIRHQGFPVADSDIDFVGGNTVPAVSTCHKGIDDRIDHIHHY